MGESGSCECPRVGVIPLLAGQERGVVLSPLTVTVVAGMYRTHLAQPVGALKRAAKAAKATGSRTSGILYISDAVLQQLP
jgi:hypothetical protein